MNAVSNRFVGQIKEGLIQIGYSEEAIDEDYDFIGQAGVQRANLVAFGDIYRHDLSTSCIAVHWCPNGEDRSVVLGQLRFLAAPLAFITTPEKVEIWPVSKEISDTPHKELSYDQVNEYFAQNRLSLMPNSLLAAKQGEGQLTFFDIDPELFPYAREVTRNMLISPFEQAVSARKQKKGKSYSLEDSRTFTMHLLAKQLGIYYTPPEIARNILNRLPIEDIPPEERFVFDGSCGSGSLLVMAYERLEALLPTHQDSYEKYRYLTEHIWGLDTDSFAIEITHLSLLLRSLPFGDNWNIKRGDFLKIDRSILPKQISIILGNPPFSEPREINKKRQETTACFLGGYLDLLAPGGLMGIILPESFLIKSSCGQARKRLLSECELLEVWQLPGEMIPLSSAPIAVLLLRKNELSKHSVVRIQKVLGRDEYQKRFLDQAKAIYSYVLPNQKQWAQAPSAEMVASPFDKLWERLQNQLKLGDIASIGNGITLGGEGYKELFFYRNPPENLKLWLHNSNAIDDPYFIDWQNQKYNCVNYPANLYRPRLNMKTVFESSKVLVNAKRAQRNNPWWLHAVIDESGYFPSKQLHCIFNPANHVSLEEITAVLNSPVANAWMDSVNLLHIDVKKAILEKMPFPEFSDEQHQQVIEYVQEIMNLKRNWFSSEHSTNNDIEELIRKLIRELDDIIFLAYGLNEEERQQILELFRGFPRPGSEWKNVAFLPDIAAPISENGRHWCVTGHVIDVNGEKNMICVWIRGFGNGESAWIPIPREMPGWALRPDAAFEADIPYEERYQQKIKNLTLTNFTPLEFGYLSDEKLFDHVAQRMKTFEEISKSNE